MINEGLNTNDVLNKTWITYGFDYDPNKVTPIKIDNFSIFANKPNGGLWASPIDSEYGWKDWCEREDFRTWTLDQSFTFKLKPTAKIWVIDNIEDLKSVLIPINKIAGHDYGVSDTCINYPDLINKVDGIYITEKAAVELRYPKEKVGCGLSAWDCELICIFNKDVIIPIDNKMKENNKKMKTKNVIRINESQLRNIVAEATKKVLNESVPVGSPEWEEMIAQAPDRWKELPPSKNALTKIYRANKSYANRRRRVEPWDINNDTVANKYFKGKVPSKKRYEIFRSWADHEGVNQTPEEREVYSKLNKMPMADALKENCLKTIVSESLRKILKEGVYDKEAQMFKQQFQQMLINGDYQTDLYGVEDDCASYDFENDNLNLSAHVYINFKPFRDGTIKISSMCVVPRIGEGDTLGNGQHYEYDIDDAQTLEAVQNKVSEDIMEWYN